MFNFEILPKYLSNKELEIVNSMINVAYYNDLEMIKEDLKLENQHIEIVHYESGPFHVDEEDYYSFGFFVNPDEVGGKLIVEIFLNQLVKYTHVEKKGDINLFVKEYLETFAHELRHVHQYVHKPNFRYDGNYQDVMEKDATLYGVEYSKRNIVRFMRDIKEWSNNNNNTK